MPILQRGDLLHGYTIQEALRSGSILAAYRAQPVDRSSPLILWTLDLAGLSEEDGLPRRLVERFAALKLLDHPNLLPIVDFGLEEAAFFWLTPFVRGKLLSTAIEEQAAARKARKKPERAWNEKTAARLLASIAGALHEIWEAGLTHGCLSPETVILAEDGAPLVFQHGLNDLFLEVEAARVPAGELSLGLAHPAFTAPERFAAQYVDWRADQFSLGAIAAAVCFGASPFSAATPLESLLRGAAPLRWPGRPLMRVSNTCLRWFTRCLVAQPAHRFPAYSGLVEPLERMAKGRPARIRLPRGTHPPRRPASPLAKAARGIGLALLPLLVGLGAWAGASGAITVIDWIGTQPIFSVQVSMVGPLAPLATPNPTTVAMLNVTRTAQAQPTATATQPPTVTSTPTPLPPTPTPSATPTHTASPTPTQPPPPTSTPVLPPAPAAQARLWGQDLPAGSTPITLDTAGRLKEVRRLGLGALHQAALAPDGRTLAIAALAGVWLQNGDLNTFLDTGDEVTAVTFSPDGSLLAAGLRTGEVQVWRWQGGFEQVTRLQGHSGAIRGIGFFDGGQRLASISADGSVRAWRIEDSSQAWSKQASEKPLLVLAIDEANNRLAVGGEDRFARTLSLEGGEPAGTPANFSEPITALAFSPTDPQLLAIGGKLGNVGYWSLYRNNALARISVLSEVTALSFGPDPNGQPSLRIASLDPAMWVYYASPQLEQSTGAVRVLPFADVRLSGNPWVEEQAALPWLELGTDTVFTDEGFFSIRWDGYTARDDLNWSLLSPMPFHLVIRLAVSPDGRWLAAGGKDQVHVFDIARGSLKWRHMGSLPPGAPFAPDSKSILIVDDQSSQNKQQVLWQIPIEPAAGENGQNLGAYISNAQVRFIESQQVVVQSNGVSATVSDLSSGLPALITLSSEEGCQAIHSTGDQAAFLFQTPWGLLDRDDELTRSVCRLAGAWKNFAGIVSPGRALVATVGEKGVIQVFEKGEVLPPWPSGADINAQWLLINAQEDLLFAGLPDFRSTQDGLPGGVRIYSLADGQVRAELNGSAWGQTTAAALSPDGTSLFLAARDGIIRQFKVRP